jgi:hypothetical protein
VSNYGGSMSKVKITNLKAGACVVNSLKIIIPGMGFTIKDSSVVEDPDLVELEHLGLISVVKIEEVKPVISKPVPTIEAKVATKKEPAKPAKPSKAEKTKGKTSNGSKKQVIQTPAKQEGRPGTSFRIKDGAEDEMRAKVVIMGDNGPEVKHMSPGINGNDGPKFVGDDDFSNETSEDGFTTV